MNSNIAYDNPLNFHTARDENPSCFEKIKTPKLMHANNPMQFDSNYITLCIFCIMISTCLFISIYKHNINSSEPSSLDSYKNYANFNQSKIEDSDRFNTLKNIRVSNVNRLIIGQLNINSVRNKFEAL